MPRNKTVKAKHENVIHNACEIRVTLKKGFQGGVTKSRLKIWKSDPKTCEDTSDVK